jgi:hypothetical protein
MKPNHPKPKKATLGLVIAMQAIAELFARERAYTADDLPQGGLGNARQQDGIRRAHLRAIKYRRARGGRA